MVNYNGLSKLIPDNVFTGILDVASKYKLTTPLRLAHFLAQCAHESANFKRTEENLNYSAERLLIVFPKYFNKELAEEYSRNKIKIASRVYANRLGNGNEESGDGWKYRGRGYIQLTGKYNYELYNNSCLRNVITNPDLVSTELALDSAGWYWDSYRNLNTIADLGNSIEVVRIITKKVNGGYLGLKERIDYFNKFYKVINHHE